MSPTRQVRLAQARGLVLSLSSRRQTFPRVQPVHLSTSMQTDACHRSERPNPDRPPLIWPRQEQGQEREQGFRHPRDLERASIWRTRAPQSHAQARDANFIHRRSAEEDSTTYTCYSTHHAGRISKTMLSRQSDAFLFPRDLCITMYTRLVTGRRNRRTSPIHDI